MATVNNSHGRQWMLWSTTDALAANFNSGDSFKINLPPNALLDEIYVDTTTAFTGATLPTLTVADTGAAHTFANAVGIDTAGRETVGSIGQFYPAGTALTVSFGGSGTATAGEVVVSVGYLVVGRANEVQT